LRRIPQLRFEEGLAVAFAVSWVTLSERVKFKNALPPIFAGAYNDFLSLGRVDAKIKEARKIRPRIDDFDTAFSCPAIWSAHGACGKACGAVPQGSCVKKVMA
jgi:hypothetical protein